MGRALAFDASVRQMPTRPTEAVVDLSAIAANYRWLREVADRPVIAVVKANAYGHGAVPVARALVREGVAMLAVALVEEGIELREAGVGAPILVLGGAYGGRYDLLVTHRLVPGITGVAHLRGLAEAARAAGVRAVAHLKLDTGMGRLGLRLADLPDLAAAANRTPEVAVEGIYTHLANADDLGERATTERQVALFDEAAERLARAGLPLRYRHLANSAGTVEYPQARQDLVRPGIMLYGYVPFHSKGARPVLARTLDRLRPALTLRTEVVELREVPEGAPISYGGKWTARRTSRIATLPVGYADGYRRQLSGRPGFGSAEVLVRGRRAPVAGTVCMDMTMVDVTDVPAVAVGDEVVLIGTQGGETVDAAELAERCGTISYEILCGIGARVPRRHVEG